MVIRLVIPLLLLFVLCFVQVIYMQEQEQIKTGKSELSRLKDEISSLEKQLNLKNKKERESFTALENYNKQNFLLNKLINKLKDELKKKESDIEYSSEQISEIEHDIDILRKNYSKYVVAVYKYGREDDLSFLINAGSFEKVVHRLKYLRKFSERRKQDLDNYVANKERLLGLRQNLEVEKNEKVTLAHQKEREENDLKKKLAERKKVITSIRKDKVELKKEIDAKKSAEVKIRNMIAKLIEEAERKKREEAERLARLELEKKKNVSKDKIVSKDVKKTPVTTGTYNINLNTSNFASFLAMKGKLNWPISGGKIIRSYGENKNAKLKTVTVNYGVDIRAGGDLNVKSVAEGVISAIDWIPGYGSVIIITHRDDFRTVYSHLSEIYVKEGDKVKTGSLLAKVGESIDGKIVHFEIWSSRNNQNPEVWLSKR